MRVGLLPGGRGSRLCCKDHCFFSVHLGVYFNRHGGYLISLILPSGQLVIQYLGS